MKILISNALTILPGEEYKTTNICIDGDTICSIGDIPPDFTADRVIDGTDMLLSPGFINAHAHTYMTVLRNRADDLNFMTWLFDRVMPLEEQITHEDVRWIVQLGCMEMLQSGITGVLDMHMYPATNARAFVETGLRAVISRGLTDNNDPEGGKRRLAEAEEEIREFTGIPTLGFMLAPHAPYTCGEKYLCKVAEKARELGVGIHTHISESRDEQAKILAAYGCTPAEYFDRCGILTEKTVCAHGVYLSDSDMELIARRGTSIAHNAASNLKLGNGFAPVGRMLEKGVNVAIGTDSSSSNNSLNMLREMQLVSLIHKGTAEDATAMPAKTVFEMATVNGAKALGWGEITGEIKVGKRADLCLFNMNEPSFMPTGNPKSALCYSSAGLRAETVLVNGRILLDKGEFTTIDAEKAMFHIKEISKRLDKYERGSK